MIRREHIKQAIDAISRRDPEIGYSLDELFGTGLIDADPEWRESGGDENFYFRFEGQRVLVNRVLFFQEGTVSIEQGLLVKFGELVKRQEIQDRGVAPDYPAALVEIREAGLRLAVRYELDYAVSRLRKSRDAALINLFEKIKNEDAPLSIQEEAPDPPYLYKGTLNGAVPALFMGFPFCMGSLMQVADLNLEFFHLRFVLSCLVRGVERNLLACVVQGRVLGLVFLALKERFLRRDLEIKYIATQRRGGEDPSGSFPRPKGVGTFLVAGVWMLAKNEMSWDADIVLDAEIGARGFYDSIGFQPRGLSAFILRRPKPLLLRAVLSIARNRTDLRQRVVDEIASLIRRHVKGLRKRPVTEKDISERKVVISCVQECLLPDSRTEFMDAALQALLRYRGKIMESEELIQYASQKGSNPMSTHGHAAGTSR